MSSANILEDVLARVRDAKDELDNLETDLELSSVNVELEFPGRGGPQLSVSLECGGEHTVSLAEVLEACDPDDLARVERCLKKVMG